MIALVTHWRGRNQLAVRVWWSENNWGLRTGVCVSVSVCFFAFVACLDSFGDKSYIQGERLAGCILNKEGGFGLGDQLREHGGQVSDRRRSRRVQRLSLEKDALSFLHPRIVLHQLRVQERILRDDVLYPLDQAVCRESRIQKGTVFSPVRECEGIHRGESLDPGKMVLYNFCLEYLQHDVMALAGFESCSSVFGVFLAI